MKLVPQRSTLSRDLPGALGQLRPIVDALLAGFVGVVVASVAVLQVAHLRDKFHVIDNTGVWLALSKYARAGTLYPPLFDGRFYGGTRYMPLPILLPAGVQAVIGNWIVSEKLVAYSFAIGLFILLYVTLRRAGCSRVLSLVLVSGVLLTTTGFLAAVGLKFDAPAVFFQLAALMVIDRSRRPRSLVLAAGLSTLAIVSKLSGIWGVLTIALWLCGRDRRALRIFLPAFTGLLAATFGALELASNGRMSANLDTLSLSSFEGKGGADEHSSGLTFAFSHLSSLVPSFARLTLFLLPVALGAIVLAIRSRRPTIFQLALVVQTVVLLAVLSDPGADQNHLIDLAVLTAVVVGGLLGAQGSGRWHATGLKAAAVVVILAVGIPFYTANILPETKFAVRTIIGIGDARYTLHPLSGHVSANDTLLTDDPYVAYSVDQLPVVLDPFMFQRLTRLHPSWAARLASRVDHKEFDHIVLESPLVAGDTGALGLTVNNAIEKSYVLANNISTVASGNYAIYVPARAHVRTVAAP